IAYFLLRPLPQQKNKAVRQVLLDVTLAGTAFAAMAMSDLISMLPAVILSIVVVGLIHGVLFQQQGQFWWRLMAAGGLGVMLEASKRTAIFYVMRNFPRSEYTPPGTYTIFQSLGLVVRCLFISPAWDFDRMNWIVNWRTRWQGRHEWEYSLSLIALALLLY